MRNMTNDDLSALAVILAVSVILIVTGLKSTIRLIWQIDWIFTFAGIAGVIYCGLFALGVVG